MAEVVVHTGRGFLAALVAHHAGTVPGVDLRPTRVQAAQHLGRDSEHPAAGVAVEAIDEPAETARVRVDVAVSLDAPVPETVARLQEHVATEVERAVGLRAEVAVDVVGLAETR